MRLICSDKLTQSFICRQKVIARLLWSLGSLSQTSGLVYASSRREVELLPKNITEQLERMWLRGVASRGTWQ